MSFQLILRGCVLDLVRCLTDFDFIISFHEVSEFHDMMNGF